MDGLLVGRRQDRGPNKAQASLSLTALELHPSASEKSLGLILDSHLHQHHPAYIRFDPRSCNSHDS